MPTLINSHLITSHPQASPSATRRPLRQSLSSSLPLHIRQVCRSLVRYLKGHGSDYAFDTATWAHYRRVGLTKTELFKVLRPFHAEDATMQVQQSATVAVRQRPTGAQC